MYLNLTCFRRKAAKNGLKIALNLHHLGVKSKPILAKLNAFLSGHYLTLRLAVRLLKSL